MRRFFRILAVVIVGLFVAVLIRTWAASYAPNHQSVSQSFIEWGTVPTARFFAGDNLAMIIGNVAAGILAVAFTYWVWLQVVAPSWSAFRTMRRTARQQHR